MALHRNKFCNRKTTKNTMPVLWELTVYFRLWSKAGHAWLVLCLSAGSRKRWRFQTFLLAGQIPLFLRGLLFFQDIVGMRFAQSVKSVQLEATLWTRIGSNLLWKSSRWRQGKLVTALNDAFEKNNKFWQAVKRLSLLRAHLSETSNN